MVQTVSIVEKIWIIWTVPTVMESIPLVKGLRIRGLRIKQESLSFNPYPLPLNPSDE